MSEISFGTSGWRGIIAEDFTFASLRRAVAAVAAHVREQGQAEKGLVVGYDTRFLSDRFARTAAEVLAGAGVRAFLAERDVPTPVVAHEILARGTAGGLMLTASHNPAEWNGLKVSEGTGGPALPEVTQAIAARANALAPDASIPELPLDEAEGRGLIARIDPQPRYLARLRELVDFEAIRRARLSVVVDVLYGTARGYLDAALQGAGASVTVLHADLDPSFGGGAPDPSARMLVPLARTVGEVGAVAGLACDGDADRFGVVDRDGSFVEPNYVVALVLHYLLATRGWPGDAGRSVATTHLIDAVAHRHGRDVHETPVGFKYLGELIGAGKLVLGGEESAGLSIRGHVPEKDGILACLLVAEVLAGAGGRTLGALLEDLYRDVGTFRTRRINLNLTPEAKARLVGLLAIPPAEIAGRPVLRVNRLDGVKLLLPDDAWVLLRPSGTEPVLRLYVEARTDAELDTLAAATERLLAGEEGDGESSPRRRGDAGG